MKLIPVWLIVAIMLFAGCLGGGSPESANALAFQKGVIDSSPCELIKGGDERCHALYFTFTNKLPEPLSVHDVDWRAVTTAVNETMLGITAYEDELAPGDSIEVIFQHQLPQGDFVKAVYGGINESEFYGQTSSY